MFLREKCTKSSLNKISEKLVRLRHEIFFLSVSILIFIGVTTFLGYVSTSLIFIEGSFSETKIDKPIKLDTNKIKEVSYGEDIAYEKIIFKPCNKYNNDAY